MAEIPYLCLRTKPDFIMENFSHFLITRFNLNLYERDKHAAPTRTARWLEHRF